MWVRGGVLILECTDISISGITVDYDPPAHHQGEVVATNAASSNPAATAAVHAAAAAACSRCTNGHVASFIKAPGFALRQWDRKSGQWATIGNTNCYPGAGATIPLGPEPCPCCHNNQTGAKSRTKISLAACQAGCSSDPACTAIITGPHTSPPPAPPGPPAGMVSWLVRTDRGFPDPHQCVSDHSIANDPSNNYMNSPAIWPKHIGFGCNRTLGCPGHGAGVLLPRNGSLPAIIASFLLLASARSGDKVTISM